MDFAAPGRDGMVNGLFAASRELFPRGADAIRPAADTDRPEARRDGDAGRRLRVSGNAVPPPDPGTRTRRRLWRSVAEAPKLPGILTGCPAPGGASGRTGQNRELCHNEILKI